MGPENLKEKDKKGILNSNHKKLAYAHAPN